ncbi:asparagine synthase (glutamine-hydrolyzing) [Pseudoalteromonas aurantia]|uniref:asparagine synthase (glutamine-hydrolyzing) n=1 Tax=Pseudoalteromonas aurantia TaxID=43654 RepID=UPI00110BDFE6|nr:asparagine synthase (glutamine-hydrolyzing) [Pseudoalteromonas aurantia]TMO60458.1 asparagine synthase (glutamine-hydrolyzing) [Pseudoalteromonas aurantia]
MCGILVSQLSKVDSFDLINGLSSIKHRGPDQSNTYIDTDSQTYIGHNRLAINGGLDAVQPMLSECTPWVIGVNGEIYNDKSELDVVKTKFRTKSDTEFALRGIEQFGVNFISELDGEFSLCLYNRKTKSLYLARDRNGSKPLYYYQSNEKFIAASEIKALLATGVPAVWNKNYLMAKERFLVGAEQTFVKNIYSLPPGNILECKNNEVQIYSYCKILPSYPDTFEKLDIDYESAINQFDTLLKRAVSKRLPNENFACYLSSGVDSSYICAMASRLTKKTSSISIGFTNSTLDESTKAEKFAKQLGIQHHTLSLSQSDLINAFESAVYHAESIVPNMNVAAKFLLSKQTKKLGFRIALTGEGADESLLGYNFFQHDIATPQKYQHNQVELFKGQARLEKRLNFTPSAASSTFSISSTLNSLRLDEYYYTHNQSHLIAPDDELITSPLGYSQWLHYNTVFQDYNLQALGDKTELAHSIEGRQPFLDNKVVEFLHSLPTNFKYHNGVNKRILRDVYSKNFPEFQIEQQKIPFLAPPNLAQNVMYQLLNELHAVASNNVTLGVYDIHKVINYITSLIKNKTTLTFSEDIIVCHMLSILYLQKHFHLKI